MHLAFEGSWELQVARDNFDFYPLYNPNNQVPSKEDQLHRGAHNHDHNDSVDSDDDSVDQRGLSVEQKEYCKLLMSQGYSRPKSLQSQWDKRRSKQVKDNALGAGEFT